MKLTSVNSALPVNEESEPHMKKLLMKTEKYGLWLGFYDGVNFRTSYAEVLENVTHWAYVEDLECDE